jgi:hypothetical protein
VVEEIQEDRLVGGEHPHGGLGQPVLGVGVDVEPAREGVLMRADGRQHGAAVGAARDATAFELGQVPARGHRRHAEDLLDLGDRHRARRAHPVGDLATACLGQHTRRLI